MGGTDIGANTNYDRTVYHNKFPSTQLKKWLMLYTHRFKNPVFREFQAELEVVYEEKNRLLDNSFRQAIQEVSKQFYQHHPYGQRKLIGTVEDLKTPSLNKMEEFFNTWYVPNNMALVLSGDIEPERAKPLIKQTSARSPERSSPSAKPTKRQHSKAVSFIPKEWCHSKEWCEGIRCHPLNIRMKLH